MEKRNFKNDDVKKFFLNLIKDNDWKKNYKWADDLPYLNGTDGFIRCLPFNILLTQEARGIFEENQCFWYRDLVFNLISAIDFLDYEKDFQVWYLLVDEDDKAYIICENGNDELLLYFQIPYTDFRNYGNTALRLFYENNTIYLPNQR